MRWLPAAEKSSSAEAQGNRASTFFRLLPEELRLSGELPHFFVPHHAGGDWVPDVAAPPSFIAPDGVSRWSDWGGDLGPQDIVLIPKGARVIYDMRATRPVAAIGVRGALEFAIDRSTLLRVGTILVYETGRLRIGRTAEGEPSGRGVNTTILFEGAVDTVKDPTQFTIGLIAVGGSVHIEGHEVRKPFARLASPARAGLKNLVFEEPVAWKRGDRLFLADTQIGAERTTFRGQCEEAQIAQVDGGKVTLVSPLRHAHSGYVAHLTRSITLRSATADSTAWKLAANPRNRAHVIFAGETEVVLRNAAFVDLGRTLPLPLDDAQRNSDGRLATGDDSRPRLGNNQRGRYALHLHHLARRAIVEGNVVDGALKWGIVIHGTHAEVRRNVVVRFGGAAIATEDGNETGIIEGNLIVGTGAGSGIEDVTIVNTRRDEAKSNSFSHGGYGYWMSSPLVRLRDNIAAGDFRVAAFAYFLFGREGMTLPMVEGANAEALSGIDPRIPPGGKFNPAYQAVLEFRRNRADLALGDGFLSYYSNGNRWAVDQFEARIRGLKNRGVIFFYSAPRTDPRSENQSLVNSVLLGPYALGLDAKSAPNRPIPNWQGLSIGVDGNVEGSTPIYNIRDCRIEGFYDGVLVAKGGGDIVRARLKNFRNITVPAPVFPSTPTNIIDTTYENLSSTRHPQENIYLVDDASGRVEEVRRSNNVAQVRNWIGDRMDVRVYNYNGTGRDFQIYYRQQHPDFVIPLLELTNRQAHARYGIAMGGGVAPAGRQAKINGYIGPIEAPRPGIRYSEMAASPEFRFHYVVKQTSLEKSPPPAVFQEDLHIKEGLNLITRQIAYNGSTFQTTFLIWGRFGSSADTPRDAHPAANPVKHARKPIK